MRKKVLVLVLGIMLAISVLVPVTAAHAWPWSDTYNVEVNVNTQGINAINAFDCKSAIMSVNGRTYSAGVTNPWFSNNCRLNFSNVKVPTNGYYTVRLTYKYYTITSTKNISIYLQRPTYATLSRSVTFNP